MPRNGIAEILELQRALEARREEPSEGRDERREDCEGERVQLDRADAVILRKELQRGASEDRREERERLGGREGLERVLRVAVEPAGDRRTAGGVRSRKRRERKPTKPWPQSSGAFFFWASIDRNEGEGEDWRAQEAMVHSLWERARCG